MLKSSQDVALGVSRIIEPVLEDLGIELVDVEFLTDRGRWVLRVYADRPGGISLDDCARVSREIGDLLDVRDLIRHPYVLEVSSPGLNRPLKRERDFVRATGSQVKLRLCQALEGRRNFAGRLKGVEQGRLRLEVDGREFLLSLAEVEKANLVHEFE